MSQENVEIVRAGYEEFSRTGTFAPDLLDPDVTAYDPPDAPDPRVYQGREGLLLQLQNVADAFDELRWDAVELIDAGEKVVVATQMVGKGKESEVRVSVRVFHVWTIRDGRGVELRTLFTREEALEAAGLSE
jgi:ketosteroid isomerase-like protein